MAEHTPLPWRVSGEHVVGSQEIHVFGRKRNARGISSASYSSDVCYIQGDLDLPGPLANAEFIVHACNCHDDLLDALKQIAAIVEDSAGDNALLTRRSLNATGLVAQHAIAKAKEKK